MAMKKIVVGLVMLNVFMLLFSCSALYSNEGKGDKAYSQAKHAEGLNKRILQKRAYIFYQKAFQAQPDKNKLSEKFKQRFIEMSLVRANMVLTEGTYDMDAIKLFMGDIDTLMSKDISSDIRQQYGDFIVIMADSSVSRNRLDDALAWLTKAQTVVDNPAPIQAKQKSLMSDFTKQFYEMASQAYVEGKDQKDPEALIKAEYYVKLVLVYDSAYPGAAALLSNLYKANLNTVSGYAKVIEGKLDPRVNKYDIYLAVVSGTGNMTISMFNNSYNPLRLKPENFSLVDDKGEKYTAAASSKIDPEILDTQRETKKITLVFPKTKSAIKKLVYSNGDHYAEKDFF
jgi:tetratricopeptide (TPR) repeat protein